MVKAKRKIDHLLNFGNDLGATTEASKEEADIAVVLLDGEGQVFAGEELVFGNEAMKALPVIRYERGLPSRFCRGAFDRLHHHADP